MSRALPSVPRARRELFAAMWLRAAIVLGLTLIFLQNSVAWFIYSTGIARGLAYPLWISVLLAAVLWWALNPCRLTREEMGLAPSGWVKSAALGAGLGLLLIMAALLFFSAPFPLTAHIRYREIQGLDALGLLWRLTVEVTLATAIAEELLFRGILQALFRRALPAAAALISTNVAFALWHVVSNFLSVQQNPLMLPLLPPTMVSLIGYLGSLLAVGIGGLALSVLRERTAHLAGSIVLHGLVVGALSILIYAQR